MISTVTVEAHFSATYVDNYLDTLENLPDDVQRHLSRIRELDVLQRSHIRDVHLYYEQWAFHQPQNGTAAAAAALTSSSSSSAAANGPDLASGSADSTPPSSSTAASEPNAILKRAIARIQQSLIAAQELGDEKLQILQQLHDLIEHRIRLLDQDYMHLGNDFFTSIRLDCSRDEGGRLTDGNGADRYHSSGASGGGANNGTGAYGMGGGNGPGQGNNGFGGIGSNAHVLHASNGGGTPLGAGGSGGTTLGSQPTTGGSGGASGIYGGNNGGMLGSERTSKRARRTRNEQQGAGSANGGSNTPNSTCGASPMDIDPTLDCVGSIGAGSGGSDGGESAGNLLAGGAVKQEPGSGLMSGSGNGGNRGNSGGVSGGSTSGAGGIGGHNSSLSGSGASGQGQGGNSATLGGAAKGNNGGGAIATGSSSSHGGGNGGPAGGSGAQSSISSQSSGGAGKKGTGGGASSSREGASGGGGGSGAGGANSGKKKKRKTGSGGRGSQTAREAREETPAAEESVDPDEPTYCLCDQISFGEMILCDNDLCPIEWFHFSCVSLVSKPKGRWYCPNCRGDRPNLMKPKQQFLKELERYNKEKEEKT
uniref:Inhibitor of growth protein n=2 Tax=Anopheles triannulatus TaxID=58253 RepID=A0A2M4AMG7_9DIPT